MHIIDETRFETYRGRNNLSRIEISDIVLYTYIRNRQRTVDGPGKYSSHMELMTIPLLHSAA